MRKNGWKYLSILTTVILAGWTSHGSQSPRILFRVDGTQAGENLGAVVATLGDLDGDGIPDFGASAPLYYVDQHPEGRVLVYSGATREVLFQINPAEGRGMCWAMASAGDIERTGVPGILIGAPYTAPPIEGLLYGAGSAAVYSGRTQDILFLFNGEQDGIQLGHSIDGIGDVDGDGVPDIMIGAPYAGGEVGGVGRVDVRSGTDGTILFHFFGANQGDYLGWSVAGIGDVDRDGVPDLIMAAPLASPGGRTEAGSVFVRSGATGELIFQLDGERASDNFGVAVAAGGDIDGDGVPDIIVGAPGASPNGRAQAGSVFVYSGATGQLIFRFEGPERLDGFGASVAGGQDVDGDQVPDIIVGAPSASPDGRSGAGSAFVFSGSSGSLVFRFDGFMRGDNLGASVAAAGDLNREGRSAVIVGSPNSSPGGNDGAGSVFILTGAKDQRAITGLPPNGKKVAR